MRSSIIIALFFAIEFGRLRFPFRDAERAVIVIYKYLTLGQYLFSDLADLGKSCFFIERMHFLRAVAIAITLQFSVVSLSL